MTIVHRRNEGRAVTSEREREREISPTVWIRCELRDIVTNQPSVSDGLADVAAPQSILRAGIADDFPWHTVATPDNTTLPRYHSAW